MSYLAIKNARL